MAIGYGVNPIMRAGAGEGARVAALPVRRQTPEYTHTDI